jgi:acetyl-CoA synthetase
MEKEVSLKRKVFRVTDKWKRRAYVSSMQRYKEMWQRSMEDPEGFWGKIAEEYVTWFKKWDKVCQYDWSESPEHKWFLNGRLNVSYNCLDRQLEKRGDKTAIIFEGNDPSDTEGIATNSFMKRYADLPMS